VKPGEPAASAEGVALFRAIESSRPAGHRLFTFGIAPEETGAYLSARGFDLLEDLAGEALTRRYFGSRARAESSNEYQRIARARVAGPA
jgi:hypothetical protein